MVNVGRTFNYRYFMKQYEHVANKAGEEYKEMKMQVKAVCSENGFETKISNPQ